MYIYICILPHTYVHIHINARILTFIFWGTNPLFAGRERVKCLFFKNKLIAMLHAIQRSMCVFMCVCVCAYVCVRYERLSPECFRDHTCSYIYVDFRCVYHI